VSGFNGKLPLARGRGTRRLLVLLFLTVPLQATAGACLERTEERLLDAHKLVSEMLVPQLKRATEPVRVNGAEFTLLSGATALSMEQVEETLSTSCHSSRELKPHFTRLKRGSDEELLLSLCPAAALDLAGARLMLSNFSRTGSLTAFGDWTAIYVRGTPMGSQLLAWTPTGDLSPATMMAVDHDAPGADLPGILRPAGRRILSASVGGRPLLVIYRTTQAPLRAYATSLRAAGYTVRVPPGSTELFMSEHLEHTHLALQVANGREHLLVVTLLP
jgi:hypothetical protein